MIRMVIGSVGAVAKKLDLEFGREAHETAVKVEVEAARRRMLRAALDLEAALSAEA